jgi:hypothetical protein
MRLRRQFAKLHALFARHKPADDLGVEIRSHLQIQEQENPDAGTPPEEARYAALRRFGNAALVDERSRAIWDGPPSNV